MKLLLDFLPIILFFATFKYADGHKDWAAQFASEHFGFLAMILAADVPASSALTQQRLGWQPTHPGLIDDLEEGHYFKP